MMTYTPFLIGKFATGIDKSLQPWLIPEEAQVELLDGFVYRGVWEKRPGYNYFAIGLEGGAPYTESRMVSRITSEPVRTSAGALVTGNGTAGPYTFRLQDVPVRRGTITITGGANTATDDGAGAFIAPATGTINYTNGDVVVTFGGVVGGGVQITATYDQMPGLPVMGIANFYTASNTREMLVMDTRRVNKYNTGTNRLDYIGKTVAITGVTNAASAQVIAVAHGLTTNDFVFIYGVQGIEVAGVSIINNGFYQVTVTGVDTFTIPLNTGAASIYASGGIMQQVYSGNNSNFFTWTNYPDAADNNRLLFCNNKDVIQVYDGTTITNYTYNIDGGITTLSCLLMFQFKDRLVLLRTIENGTNKGYRIRISGTGASSDDFRTTATGAGVIDIPDSSWIMGAAFNRDDLIIFTEYGSVWALKFTGNDVVPFTLDKIDPSRGCGAPFSAITYLNRTTAASPRGLIITDGYRVERMDQKIPEYSYNNIDPDNFRLCFAGTVDEDRDHYLIHPSKDQDTSDRILVTNYEEDNFQVYRIPLSCMGNYVNSFDITWNDLSAANGYNTWEDLSRDYASWNDFAYTKGTPIAIGGGHNGQIWRLNLDESEDNPLRIRAISYPDAALTPWLIDVETDFNNYAVGDYIYFSGVGGLTDINNKQFGIISFSTANRVFRIDKMTNTTTAYTSGGQAARVIPFDCLTKQFNPYVEEAAKVRCGWLYFYVSSTNTWLTDANGGVPAQITIEIYTDDRTAPTQISNFAVSPYRADSTNLSFESGAKKWNKIWINQTAKFIQLRVKNTQAGAKIRIHAMMPGFAPVGRLI